jgi:hypothetical protein
MASLLDEAQELIELSLQSDTDKKDYDHKARLWIEKAKATLPTHDHGSGSCASCGFDLACPSCGG